MRTKPPAAKSTVAAQAIGNALLPLASAATSSPEANGVSSSLIVTVSDAVFSFSTVCSTVCSAVSSAVTVLLRFLQMLRMFVIIFTSASLTSSAVVAFEI